MMAAIVVLAYAGNGVASSTAPLPARVELLGATLDALWSEDSGTPADIVVHGDPACTAVARREHGKRVRVIECAADRPWGEALNTLVDVLRHRFFVLLESGVRPTPGWLRELTQVAEQDGMLVGPCLPLGAATGVQAAAVPPQPSRCELRRAATRLRFQEPRYEVVDTLAPSCIGVPRDTLNRIGRFDARYESLGGVLLDFQHRVRSRGGRLLLARRALLGASLSASLPPRDREALTRREPFFMAIGEGCPPVALELEADDPACRRLRELANGLIERGIPLRTFSGRGRLLNRPSHAPHVQATALETATQGAALVLRRGEWTSSIPALRLEFTGARETSTQSEGVLRLAHGDVRRSERLDAWALAVCAAARAAAGDAAW
jgi:hypothetical protein